MLDGRSHRVRYVTVNAFKYQLWSKVCCVCRLSYMKNDQHRLTYVTFAKLQKHTDSLQFPGKMITNPMANYVFFYILNIQKSKFAKIWFEMYLC